MSRSISPSSQEKEELKFAADDGAQGQLATLSADEETASKSRAEKVFLWRLDVILLTWAWFAYLIKMIDASNYKTAYASGMKEDRNFKGIDLNLLDTWYRVGYILFLIPSQVILTRIRPSIWLPTLEIAWGVLTGLMAVVPNVKSMIALRFFIGVLEASSYPGIICILCSWYTPKELATRIAIFGTSYPASNIFVGFMQAALHKGMNGTGGLKGWQWLFVFNAIMTLIVAVGGYWFVPDDPANTKVWWLSPEQREIARERVKRVEKLPPTNLSRALLKKIFSRWVIYVFTIAYALWSWAQNSNGWIVLFLKAEGMSVEKINLIPIGGYVLQIVVMVLIAYASDRTGWRLFFINAQMTTLVVGTIILSVWPASFGVKMLGYYLLWLSNAAGPVLVSWMAELCPTPEERSLSVGVAVTWTFAIDCFANIFIYPANKAPNYPVGYKAALGFGVGCMGVSTLFKYMADHEKSKRRSNESIEEEAK